MPKFLVETKYTLEGIRGVRAQGGSARAAAAKAVVEELGGTLESFHFAFGSSDVYLIADMPDNAAAGTHHDTDRGGGATTRTTVLLTPEEMDAAAKMQSTYKPPGG